MAASDDDCGKLAADCGRWADETQDKAAREAFRQMAKVWGQLAFGFYYKPPNEPDETPPTAPEDLPQPASRGPIAPRPFR